MKRADRELAEIMNAFSSSSSTTSIDSTNSSISKNASVDVLKTNPDKRSVPPVAPTNNNFLVKNDNKKLKRDHVNVLNNWIDAANCDHAVDRISEKDLLNKLQVNKSSNTGKSKSLPSNLVVIENFLPNDVAQGLYSYLDNLPRNKWLASSSAIDAEMEHDNINNSSGSSSHQRHDSDDKSSSGGQTQSSNYDTGAGSTQHAFAATEGIVCSPSSTVHNDSVDNMASLLAQHKDDNVMDRFQRVLYAGIVKNQNNSSSNNNSSSATRSTDKIQLRAVFQCAKYTSGHYIEPHDDVASEVIGDVLYVRDTAIILYLSPEWEIDDGGIFLDHSVYPVRPIVPQFNTLVAFKVPKLHEVTKIPLNCKKKRYSIFGWLLKPAPVAAVAGGEKTNSKINKSSISINDSCNVTGSSDAHNNNNNSNNKRNQRKKKNKNKQKNQTNKQMS